MYSVHSHERVMISATSIPCSATPGTVKKSRHLLQVSAKIGTVFQVLP